MPRRKISVRDVMDVLSDSPEMVQAITQPSSIVQPTKKNPYGSTDMHYPQQRVKNVKVTLFARHSIGSGGVTVVSNDQQQIECAGVQTYGPGVCTVPVEHAAHLMHADMVARQADEDMLSREQKYRFVTEQVDSSGNRRDVGLTVHGNVLDAGFMLTAIPIQNTYRIG